MRGRCSHTVQAVFDAVLSPHPDAGDCEHAGGAGSVFYTSMDSPYVVVLVRRVVVCSSVFRVSGPDPLVELCHWLQGVGTGGAGELEVT